MIFRQLLRQVEGFLRSLFELMGVALDVSDHTTLSRRSRRIDVSPRARLGTKPIGLVLDSSGLAVFGEGE